jgi:hypothetical protein
MIYGTGSLKEKPQEGGEECLSVCLGKNKRNNCSKKGEIGISLAAQIAQEHFKLLWLASFI